MPIPLLRGLHILLTPWKVQLPPGLVAVTVTPGDATIAEGDPLEIAAVVAPRYRNKPVVPGGTVGWRIMPKMREALLLPIVIGVVALISITPFLNPQRRSIALIGDGVLAGRLRPRLRRGQSGRHLGAHTPRRDASAVTAPSAEQNPNSVPR